MRMQLYSDIKNKMKIIITRLWLSSFRKSDFGVNLKKLLLELQINQICYNKIALYKNLLLVSSLNNEKIIRQ